MRFRSFVVWLTIAANLLVRTTALAAPLDEGAANGAAANTASRGLINQPSAASVVPGYTTTPPETALAGTSNLSSNATARLATCLAAPTTPGCEAIQAAISSANTARPAVTAADPAVAEAGQIAKNPSLALGSLAQYYSGCTTADVPTTGTPVTRACTVRTNGSGFACSNRLTVDVQHANTCDPGIWFAQTSGGSSTFAAQCIPGRPVSRQHFRATFENKDPYFFDYSLAGEDVFPVKVKVMGQKVDPDLGVIDISLYLVDNECAENNCSITAIVTEDERYMCVDQGGEADRVCTTEKPFLPVYAPCGPGSVSGENLHQSSFCIGPDPCPPATLDERICFAPAPAPPPPLTPIVNATDLSGSSSSNRWISAGSRPLIGWKPNPKYGPFPIMTLGYAQPRHITTPTDSWASKCSAATAGGRCTPSGPPRCVDGPSTRNVTGVPIARACWNYETPMTCTGSAALPDDCQALATAGCSLQASNCRTTDVATGACSVEDRTYSCPQGPQTVTTASNCPSNVSCVGSTCFSTAYAPDADFARSMSMLEAAREAGVYLDTDRLQVFKGEPQSCRDRLLNNCCYTNGSGAGMTNQRVFGSGTKLVYDILMNSQNRQFIMQGMSALITGSGFSGSFTAYGVTIAVNGAAVPTGSVVIYSSYASGAAAGGAAAGGAAAGGAAAGGAAAGTGAAAGGAAAGSGAAAGGGVVIAFDPWSLVIAIIIYVIISMASCNEGESRLAMQEGAKLCHTIGTYCSQCFRVLGRCVSCTEHTTGKCCFNSMLARIVNEQGRAQVGKGWGVPQTPDCSGFTIAQLQSLDFAAMDLSEFYASLIPKSPDVAAWQANSAGRVDKCYYGQGKCGP
ncbi:MAG: conjugal transfer protein TraN [Burkholderiales bacterium]